MSSTKERILIVDDEEPIRKLLKARFEREGYAVETAIHPEDALTKISDSWIPSVVVSDLKMPGRDGFWLLAQIKMRKEPIHFILATGFGEKEVAIQALRDGASDYLEKPFDLDELSLAVKRCVAEIKLKRENTELLARLSARVERIEQAPEKTEWIESKSKAMESVEKWLKILARESSASSAEEPSVLVLGESGTGKERVAVRIHRESRRSKGPFIAVNCANFTGEMLESELFGHEKGAFTGALTQKRGLFELASGGTLFLDEIGEMDQGLQPRLLRVLQEKIFRRLGGNVDIKSDVRVVAATNRDIEQMISTGSFREDLYHRLNRVVITLPPLRDRPEDIFHLAQVFGRRAYQSRHKKWQGFSEEAKGQMLTYPWPGNIRELMNVVERAALLDEGQGAIPGSLLSLPRARGTVERIATPEERGHPSKMHSERESGVGFTQLKKRWSSTFEREYFIELLTRHEGNISSAAREAMLDRSNFMKLLKKSGISVDSFRHKRAA